MIKIRQAVIVEGKYDKIKLSSFLDAVIIPTEGFGIFKDKEKRELIKLYAKTVGIVIVTDSDSAGFKIRNYVKGFIKDGEVINVYIPDIFGKEKRKLSPSSEGKLGVEGISKDIILKSFEKAGVLYSDSVSKVNEITKMDLYIDGLIGCSNSSILRSKLLFKLNLPERLTTNGMLQALNVMLTKEEYKEIISSIKTV